MERTLAGLHHVTAITADGRANLDFYTGVLGLRLVKVTVNFDDPASYHLYFGDELGRPGTAMTFFVWPGARGGGGRSRAGPLRVSATSFSVPAPSLPFWRARLGVTAEPVTRFGDRVLSFTDPDGTPLELVAPDPAAPRDPRAPWTGGPVPAEHAIRGFRGVTLATGSRRDRTAEFLESALGFTRIGEEADRTRFLTGTRSLPGDDAAAEPPASIVDVVGGDDRLTAVSGAGGAGAVHHVAFRTRDESTEAAWRSLLADRGAHVSPMMERHYFRSIYFREPGGVLFEIATDGPGFTVDEPAAALGGSLRLPPALEPSRAAIERALPALRFPPEPGA